jgi:uncharacterized protein YjdB
MNANPRFNPRRLFGAYNLRLFLLASAVSLASGCSSPLYPDNSTPEKIAVQSVKVSPQTIVFVAIGQTKTLSLAIAPSNATDQVVSWSSTDPTIASVDANGKVTAKAVGSGVFITASSRDGAHQASANVTVSP